MSQQLKSLKASLSNLLVYIGSYESRRKDPKLQSSAPNATNSYSVALGFQAKFNSLLSFAKFVVTN